jgi:hypothetical protein
MILVNNLGVKFLHLRVLSVQCSNPLGLRETLYVDFTVKHSMYRMSDALITPISGKCSLYVRQ